MLNLKIEARKRLSSEKLVFSPNGWSRSAHFLLFGSDSIWNIGRHTFARFCVHFSPHPPLLNLPDKSNVYTGLLWRT